MDKSPIIIEKIYAAPVEKVWKAITDKEQMKEWYFDIEDFVLEVGAVSHFDVPFEELLYRHRFVILEIIPDKKLQHRWEHPTQSKGTSVLTWVLEPVGDNTKVTLIHEGTENFADAGKGFEKENYIAGWNEILGTYLKDFLEK